MLRAALPRHRRPAGYLSPRSEANAEGRSPRFRPATPADAPAIRALVWSARMNPLGLDPARFTVADGVSEGGPPSLAAVGQVVPLPPPPGGATTRVEIRSLVVAPGARGTGLGTALLAALLDRAAGADAVWLTTLAGRAPFYERAGFTVVAGGGGDKAPPAAASLLCGLSGGGGGGGGDGGGGGGGDGGGRIGDRGEDIPAGMRFEVLAGSVVGPLLGGDSLVVMCRRQGWR